MQARSKRFSLPAALSVLAGVMFVFLVAVLVVGQPAFSQYYENRSLLKNLTLWPASRC